MNYFCLIISFLMVQNTYSNSLDCHKAKLFYKGKEINPNQRSKFPSGLEPPHMNYYENIEKAPTSVLACGEYPNVAGYVNCLTELYKNSSSGVNQLKKCDVRNKSELKGKLKDFCDKMFPSISIEQFDASIKQMENELENTKGFIKFFLAKNGIDVEEGNFKLSGCIKDGAQPDMNIPENELFQKQSKYGGRFPYLDCPLSKKLPWEDDDQKYCALLMKEFQLDQDSPMGYLIDDLYDLKKKNDEEIIKEYATKLRTLAVTELLQKYALEFGTEIEYPGDLSDPNNICYKSSIQQKFNQVMKKTPHLPAEKDDIAISCRAINAQITGQGEDCVGNFCGVKMDYLERNSFYKDDVIARHNVIKSEISNSPILSSLFNGSSINSNSFPRISECTDEDKITDKFVAELRNKYKANLNESLKLMCNTDRYPNSLLYKDKRLTSKLGQYTRYGELQKCIEEANEEIEEFKGTSSAILGGAGLLVGIFFPPAGLALGLAATSISVMDASVASIDSSTMNIVSSSMGDIEVISERKEIVSSKTRGAVLDVAATATGVKGVASGAGRLVQGGENVIQIAAKAGDARTFYNSTYTLTTDLFGRPSENEFYELSRAEKVEAYKNSKFGDRRYIEGFDQQRQKNDQIIQENFFINVTTKLSDLESSALATLLSNTNGEQKNRILRYVNSCTQKDILSLDKILDWCKSNKVKCPKKNKDIAP